MITEDGMPGFERGLCLLIRPQPFVTQGPASSRGAESIIPRRDLEQKEHTRDPKASPRSPPRYDLAAELP